MTTRRRGATRRRATTLVGLGLVALLALTGCGRLLGAKATNRASAGTATQPATPQSIGIDEDDAVAAALVAELNAYIGGNGGHMGVAVLDRTTGVTISVNGDKTFQTASIVKFDILATRLYQHQNAGTSMTANEKALAFKMITQSDNNAASALFGLDNRAAGLAAANKVFGLQDTTPGSAWGQTHTTPADQIRLLQTVMDPDGPINQANREYILSLMSQVEPDQRWGITAAANDNAQHVYVKNGWDTQSAFGGLWAANSIGRIIEPGHDWLIAVMSNYNHTDNGGHVIDGKLARLAVEGLRLETKLAATK